MPTETSPIYADPFDLRDGENVRPEESETEHERRVKQLAASIEADGQLYPIHIKEVDSPDGPLQIVVDGIGRRDALRLIHTKHKAAGTEPPLAWCVLNDGADMLKHAIISNFHRANNSALEIAELMAKVRKRYGWEKAPGKKGQGSNGKLAEYFGVLPSEVTEYEKLSNAPPDIKARLIDGTMSMSAALQLLKVTATEEDVETARDVRKRVVEKAREIATTEQRQKPPKPTTVGGGTSDASADGSGAVVGETAQLQPTQPVKITAQHVSKAAGEVVGKIVKAPTRKDVLDEITALDGPISSDIGRKFVQAFLRWAQGDVVKTDKLVDAWTALNGTVKPAKVALRGDLVRPSRLKPQKKVAPVKKVVVKATKKAVAKAPVKAVAKKAAVKAVKPTTKKAAVVKKVVAKKSVKK